MERFLNALNICIQEGGAQSSCHPDPSLAYSGYRLISLATPWSKESSMSSGPPRKELQSFFLVIRKAMSAT